MTTNQYGRTLSVTRRDSGNNQLSSINYGYDVHGRPNSVTDARTGATTFTFNSADQVATATAPLSQTTTSYYDSLGRVWKTTLPDSTSVTNEFYLTGQLKKTYGSRTYPVQYSYDAQGRMTNMTTWQNFANGTGWDAHNTGILQQHELIRDLDQAVATLIMDLESRRMLDKTLIVIATEFGRPPEFDGGGGRGHHPAAFSCVLAGGGLRHCGAYGETDELARKPVSNAVSVPDFFATIHAALGIDFTKDLHEGDRPIPITDRGLPIAKLLA